MYSHEYWMEKALLLANYAGSLGEVPVGALLVQDNRILSVGYNTREMNKNSLAHAELMAIDQGCKRVHGWRLETTTLYVTLEPCPMCGGGIVNSRIPHVVFGASDPKAGCFGSLTDFNTLGFNHQVEITSGILAEESSQLLKDFFRKLRKK